MGLCFKTRSLYSLVQVIRFDVLVMRTMQVKAECALQWAQRSALTEVITRTGLLSLFLKIDKKLVKATTPKTRCFLRYGVYRRYLQV